MARAYRLAATIVVAVLTLPLISAQRVSSDYEAFFTERTMRVDLWHTGGPTGEVVAFDKAVDDGAWPGSRTNLVDPLNLGSMQFELRDPETSRVLFSRGYASVYMEWESTGENRTDAKTFGESLRFPWPKAPVRFSPVDSHSM